MLDVIKSEEDLSVELSNINWKDARYQKKNINRYNALFLHRTNYSLQCTATLVNNIDLINELGDGILKTKNGVADIVIQSHFPIKTIKVVLFTSDNEELCQYQVSDMGIDWLDVTAHTICEEPFWNHMKNTQQLRLSHDNIFYLKIKLLDCSLFWLPSVHAISINDQIVNMRSFYGTETGGYIKI